MSRGHYPSVNHTRSSQEFIAPRHRLPVIASTRNPTPFSSTSSISHAHTSHSSWTNKQNSNNSNHHENSGCYGHTVSRDYSSISRAHCNDESSTWSNPHFRNPLAYPSFGGASSNENMNVKDEIQQESMDLSSSHHPAAAIRTTCIDKLPVNGDTDSPDLVNSVPVSTTATESSKAKVVINIIKKDSARIIATNSSLTEQIETREPNLSTNAAVDVIKKEPNVPSADNVEFALESMFHFDNRSSVSSSSSVIVSTPVCLPPKGLCAESVEKILKSPSPKKSEEDDNDNLAILEDSNNDKVADNSIDSVTKPAGHNVVSSTASSPAKENFKFVDSKNQNCDNLVARSDAKIAEVTSSSPSSSSKNDNPSATKRVSEKKPNENTNKNNWQVKKEDADQSSPEQIPSSSAHNPILKNVEHRFGGKSLETNTENITAATKNPIVKSELPHKTERNEEITYVEVESELEKMFAGIEDTTIDGADKIPLTKKQQESSPSVSIRVNAQNNLSTISPNSQSSTGLFDNVPVPAKTIKKKTSKKSKSTSSSAKNVKDSKQKSSNSMKDSSSVDTVTMKRVPVIHIEGSKQNPISAQIINSIKVEEDDVSDGRTSAKRKLGKNDRAVKKSATNYTIKNYDPGTSDASWVCVFCNLCAYTPGMAGEATGDLFGPYFIRTPEQINLDNASRRHSRTSNHIIEQVKKKQKRSVSVESGYMDLSVPKEQKSYEIWAHENCIVWASGVYLIGSKLMGLEEAVMEALNTICAHCSNKGATIGCRARHCNSCTHYSCALYTGWKLDGETFISTCSVHSLPG